MDVGREGRNLPSGGEEISPGVWMPRMALGTYKARGENVRQAVTWALDAGIRHIDTASCYQNERDIGEAIRTHPHGDACFVTSKVGPTEMVSMAATKEAVVGINARLNLGRPVDLILMHWPAPAKVDPRDVNNARVRFETWRVMELALETGQCRAIGVSNFTEAHLFELVKLIRIKPAINQIEMHPRLVQNRLVETCAALGVHVQAYSPLGCGELLRHPIVLSAATESHCTPSQMLISWLLHHRGVSLVVKSVDRVRIAENVSAAYMMTLRRERPMGFALLDGIAGIEKDGQTHHYCWDPRGVK